MGGNIGGRAMKAIFDVRPDSAYEDSLERYHFPEQYLQAAMGCVGDWVILREPRRGGGANAYIAVARIDRIVPDHDRSRHYFAYLRDYLRFDHAVPLRQGERYLEARLRAVEKTSLIGRTLQGHSVRHIDGADFAAIVAAGLSVTLDPSQARRLDLEPANLDSETLALLTGQLPERRIEQVLLNRKVRDAAFRNLVLGAYDNTCAVTGLRIINGGGRAEAQAAHVMPVEHGGPDIVQNGIALSATVHWLFDRHLISIGEDGCLLVSHNKVPTELRRLFRPEQQPVRRPADPRLWPHPRFLHHHRERFAAA